MIHLILLHGAIGSSNQLKPLALKLDTRFQIHMLNFSGHGGLHTGDNEFSISMFANDVLTYMEKHQVQEAAIFGYSMGGYVALFLTKHHPEKVNRIITLATKFEWNELIAEKESKMLNPDKIEEKVPAFANTLKERHSPENWKKVLEKTAEMMIRMGVVNPLKAADFQSITQPALLMLGDKDKMVSQEETLTVTHQLPDGRFELLPDTPHPIEQVNIDLLAEKINEFMS